jgi:hypothetical protein
VQGLLARNGLELVTTKLSVDPSGRIELVQVLSPDLTPSARVELERAFQSCVWLRPPAEGKAEVLTTWTREPDGR